MHHRQQQGGVGAGPHEVVLVGDLRGLGAARVEDDNRPPRSLRSRSRAGKSGTVIREPLDAIGLAPNTRKYGAVEVGDGDQQLVAVRR